MKKLLLSFLFCVTSVLPLVAGSGARYYVGQPAPVSEKMAIIKAKEIISKLIEKKQLDISWKSIKVNKAEIKIYDDKPEWVVLFTNKNVADTKKQNLYIFLEYNGEFIAINHTGL